MSKRKTLTPMEQISLELEALRRLVNNLLVDNINFKTGYYFEKYPHTQPFVREVLPRQAEGIVNKIDATEALLGLSLLPESEIVLEDYMSEARQNELIKLAGDYPSTVIRLAIREAVQSALLTGVPAPAAEASPDASKPDSGMALGR